MRREQKKADEAGTRTPKKANGNPVKPEKPKLKVRYCLVFLNANDYLALSPSYSIISLMFVSARNA